MIRRLFFILTILYSIQLNSQQQQMYTQFMFNKLALNPAYAGNESYLSAALLYRNQWTGFPGAPVAQSFNINLPRLGRRIGLGVNLEHQSIGITDKITYELMYAYKFALGNGTLSMGMNVSGRKYTQDYSDSRLFAIQNIQLDPSIPPTSQSLNLFNAGFGLYYNTNNFYLGAAVPRLIKSDIDFDKNNLFSTEVRHLFFMTGGTFIVNNDLRLTPQLFFRAAENAPFGVDLNGSVTWQDKYNAGLTFRTGGAHGDIAESLDLIFSMQLSDQLMFGFAYDIPVSKLRASSSGSLEMIMVYNLIPRKVRPVIINPRYF